MSSDIVIRVENLSKKYTLGQRPNGPDSGLRHALQNAATAPRRMWKNSKPKAENGVSALNSLLSAAAPSDTQHSTLNFQRSTPNAFRSPFRLPRLTAAPVVRHGTVPQNLPCSASSTIRIRPSSPPLHEENHALFRRAPQILSRSAAHRPFPPHSVPRT